MAVFEEDLKEEQARISIMVVVFLRKLTLKQSVAESWVHTPVSEQHQAWGAGAGRRTTYKDAAKTQPSYPLLTGLLAMVATFIHHLASRAVIRQL